MILEGIVTTMGETGGVNVAPMGAVVDDSGHGPFRRMVLRPFRTTTTLANLKRTGQAVFHVTDDVELLARSAVGHLDPPPKLLRQRRRRHDPRRCLPVVCPSR